MASASLFVIPDSTRSMPMPAMFKALYTALHKRVAKLDYLVALGTHPPMSDEALNTLLGITDAERRGVYAEVGIYNHEWKNPDALTEIGVIGEDEIATLSRRHAAPVRARLGQQAPVWLRSGVYRRPRVPA